MPQLNETQFADFKMKVKKLDRDKGTAYALGAIRGATFLNVLSTKQQQELINAVF